jgi:hypothetical protein
LKAGPFRPLALAAALTLALGQLAIGHTGVLAGVLATAFLAHGHGHGLTLLADGAHLDVVLHHEGEPSPPGAPVGFGAHAGDHVVHAASADGVRDGSRRAPLLVSLACARPASSTAPRAVRARPAPVAWPAASTLLRTTVLRI